MYILGVMSIGEEGSPHTKISSGLVLLEIAWSRGQMTRPLAVTRDQVANPVKHRRKKIPSVPGYSFRIMRFDLLGDTIQDRDHIQHQVVGSPPDFRIIPAFIDQVKESFYHYDIRIDPLEFIPDLFCLHFSHPRHPKMIINASYVIIGS
jgi:hypothetical protein